jgi:DNA-binding Lrp family transcriptional regulator
MNGVLYMKACILIKTGPGKHKEVARSINQIEGVRMAFPVLGRTDVVASVEVTSLKKLSILALKIGESQDVTATETLVGLEGVGE